MLSTSDFEAKLQSETFKTATASVNPEKIKKKRTEKYAIDKLSRAIK